MPSQTDFNAYRIAISTNLLIIGHLFLLGSLPRIWLDILLFLDNDGEVAMSETLGALLLH